MTFWIFKQSEQGQYPDEPGQTYVYDNRHSVSPGLDSSSPIFRCLHGST